MNLITNKIVEYNLVKLTNTEMQCDLNGYWYLSNLLIVIVSLKIEI